MMRTDPDRIARWVFGLGLLAYAALQLLVLIASNFYAYLNDFWILKQLASRFEGTNPAALQDGFFGYLYPLILKAIPDVAALPAAGLLSLAAAMATIAFTYLAASNIVGSAWALVAAWIVAMQPVFFLYATVAGADALAVLPVAAGLWLLVARGTHSNGKTATHIVFWAALLIAVGGTMRYHVLVLAVIPLVFGLRANDGRWRQGGAAVLGAAIGFAPQVVVNIAAGRSPLFTQQGFNVYRQAVGVDWQNTASLDPAAYTSVLTIVREHPQEFASAYLSALANFTWPLLVIAAAAALASHTKWQRFMWSAFAGAVVYALATSLAFSDRALIALTPIWAIAAATALGLGMRWTKCHEGHDQRQPRSLGGWPAAVLTSTLLAWGTLSWISAAESNIWGRVQMENARASYERALLATAPSLTSMDQVFTNDFDFYATTVPGSVPIHNGGLVQIGQKGTMMARQVDMSGVEAFLCSAFRAGIQAVVWNPGNTSGAAAGVADLLAADTVDRAVKTDTSLGLKISKLTWSDDPCA